MLSEFRIEDSGHRQRASEIWWRPRKHSELNVGHSEAVLDFDL